MRAGQKERWRRATAPSRRNRGAGALCCTGKRAHAGSSKVLRRFLPEGQCLGENGKGIARGKRPMSPAPTESVPRGAPTNKNGFLRLQIDRLFTPDRFNFRLFLGTVTGVLVIGVLAVCVIGWTHRNQQQARVRAEVIEFIRLTGVVADDMAA